MMQTIKELGEPLGEIAVIEIFIACYIVLGIIAGFIRYFITGKRFWHPYNE